MSGFVAVTRGVCGGSGQPAQTGPASWEIRPVGSAVGDCTEPPRRLARAELISTVVNGVDEDDGAP